MRRVGTILGLAMALALAMAPGALANAPEVVEDQTFTVGPEVDGFLSDVCGFEIMSEATISRRVTVFSNPDGDLDHITRHTRGLARYWTDSAETFERFALNVTIGADGSVTLAGNNWNVHGGAGGVLLNASGRIQIDPLGDVVVDGPHEDMDPSGFDDFCAALSS